MIKLIYKPNWLHSHATLPTPWPLDEKRLRLFFSARDEANRSHIGYMDIAEEKGISEVKEVLSPGATGAFDEHGVSPCCVLEVNGQLWLYYLGWQRAADVPFRNSIGLAVWDEKTGKFERMSDQPILGPNSVDPFTLSYPFVMEEKGAFRMWYGSHLSWEQDGFPMQHVIKHARSADGIHWERDGHICLDVEGDDYAFSRPWLRRIAGGFEMYYCFRGESYRLGYATSGDGLLWERKDEQIDVGELPAWAGDMQCYPAIGFLNHQKCLFFNGNGYGKTGIGKLAD